MQTCMHPSIFIFTSATHNGINRKTSTVSISSNLHKFLNTLITCHTQRLTAPNESSNDLRCFFMRRMPTPGCVWRLHHSKNSEVLTGLTVAIIMRGTCFVCINFVQSENFHFKKVLSYFRQSAFRLLHQSHSAVSFCTQKEENWQCCFEC